MASPTYGPPISIDGPSPSPPALTLLGAARSVTSADDRWINGVAIWPYPRDLPDVFDPCQSPSSAGHTKDAGTPTVEEQFGAYNVLEGITCTTRSVRDPAEWQRRAQVALEAYEHWSIEREFWAGALKPDNPHLAQAGTAPLATQVIAGIHSPKDALALLEQAIADKGGNGFIHARPLVFSQWEYESGVAIPVTSGVAKTMLGTTVVPGVGYAGTSPAGAAVGATEWVYATGPVEVRKSGVEIVPGSISEATDRAQNTTTFRAERYVLVTWDQRIHAAVEVNRSFTNLTS